MDGTCEMWDVWGEDLVWKGEGRVQFRRRVRRWEDNIKVDLQEIGWGM